MSGRADPFGTDAAEPEIDLSGLRPRKPAGKSSPVEVRKVAERASFPIREAVAPQPEPPPARVERRVYRTGRNAHLSIKADPRVIDKFYELCNREILVMG